MTTQKRRTIWTRSALFVAIIAVAGTTWYVYHKNNQNEVPTTASATPGGQAKKQVEDRLVP